ncbi:maltose alpha-D-glucosyltransferase [Geomonas sp. RF6]|uniref:maltose alpha-D-glucosyltransferase n=1 Tax=Geomonas sp. RF6 TaxID=2897342 RepID=UPI001E2AFC61|nr:maltose alpha-D-glucosyltransferase [Geomonas sp. RF6]UFS69217.1 maltose alpha-D-glucosyltransferase [Geomonas sp. RF6]
MPDRTDKNPLWFKDAVIYEVHIRSFYDSNGDGIGDIRGLMSRLPYLRDLGVTAVWVLPFYPSPLRDDGYDIADYYNINPDYGTLRDFQEFLREAHRMGMRVITELVLNHTSDQHPWFQRSRNAKPGSSWRNFYVWSENPDKYLDARIIFKDFESSNWSRDPVAKQYYWHRFYAHQPDLNYDNPAVHKAMFKVLDFWLGMGVDGLRLDAVPYLYEREGTNCENLPETYEFLKKLRSFVEERYPDRMLLAEANQWPEDAASYFGEGRACHMAFHFPLMPRMYMALQMEDSFPISNILQQTPEIPPECQWALFLRNHDELTLEMVTDEESDYMYRVYARDPRARINLGIRRRLAPLMGNDRRKIELMNVLLFTLPGTPILYYGDEIGMGDNYYLGDRNGVRTPMQWSPDRNSGFSKANPQRLYLPVIIDPEYHYEALNVENQARNSTSLFWWMKKIIDLRKRFKAFGWGTLEFLDMDNPKVLAMVREYQGETILVVVNLSRFAQVMQVGLPRFAGLVPEDMFSRNRFPMIKETPYVVLLGPYDYHLLLMTREREAEMPTEKAGFPEIPCPGVWQNVLKGGALRHLEQVLPTYLKKCRWFQGKGRSISRVTLTDTAPVPLEERNESGLLAFFEISYGEGTPETYILPLHYLPLDEAEALQKDTPEAAITRLRIDSGETGLLYDALYNPAFRQALFHFMVRRRTPRKGAKISGRCTQMCSRLLAQQTAPLPSQVGRVEQSNSAILFDKVFFFKLYRRIQEGVHPEVEVGEFLSEKAHFPHIAPLAGVMEYTRQGMEPAAMALMQGFAASEGDAWGFTLTEVNQYLERALAQRAEAEKAPLLPSPPYLAAGDHAAPEILELMGGFYPEMVSLLGKRTAKLHVALASGQEASFAPEPFTLLYQRSLYQSMRTRAHKTLNLLRKNLDRLPEALRADADSVIGAEGEILEFFRAITLRKFSAQKTRTHGDYHLGQVLYTGNDFVIIDFEGEPAKSVSERRIKHSALRDVAGMVNSFYYAAYSALLKSQIREEDIPYLEPWAEAWYRYNGAVFLNSYLEYVGENSFLPEDRDELETILTCFMLDKAVYELGYELNNRPDWVMIPLRSIIDLLNGTRKEG